MPRPPSLPAVALLCLGACAPGSLHWSPAEPQDPAPSGPRYLRLYKEAHFRELGVGFRGSITTARLLDRLARARVLFLGDHHVDDLLHDRMLGLLAELDRAGIRYDLGLECIGTQDEVAVHAFLAGSLTLDDLVRTARTRWPENWLDGDAVDSTFYRALLAHARAGCHEIFALEPTPRLALFERDRVIASTIRARARSRPGVLQVVVVGETHLLGEGRLVRRVDLPHVAIGARLSVALRERAQEGPDFPPQHAFAESEAGLLFFLPLVESMRPD